MIYLAGPYSHPTPEGREANFRIHEDVAVRMLRAGLHPYSPIVHWHAAAERYDMPTDAGFWEEHNRAILKRSEQLWVLPRYEASVGTLFEIRAAKEFWVPTRFLSYDVNGVIRI